MYATAITSSVAVTGTTGGGHVTVYPGGTNLPTAATLTWFGSGQTLSTGFNVGLGTGSNTGKVHVYSGGSAHVIVDVTGYYVEQINAVVAPDASLYASTNRIADSSRLEGFDAGGYKVSLTDDLDATSCAVSGTAESPGNHVVASGQDGYVAVAVTDQTGEYADDFVDIHVSC